jgi:hypothetical protein
MHFTRVLRSTTFADGLQPTGSVLDAIWRDLGSVAAQLVEHDRWDAFRHGFHRSGSQFAKQLAVKRQPELQGPFGFLVAEAGKGTSGVHKNFTLASEVVEDICAGFLESTRVDLAAAWRAVAARCIVVFETEAGDIGQHAVRAALMYAHHSFHQLPQGVECNSCYDGGGRAVPRHDIVDIVWPDTT